MVNSWKDFAKDREELSLEFFFEHCNDNVITILCGTYIHTDHDMDIAKKLLPTLMSQLESRFFVLKELTKIERNVAFDVALMKKFIQYFG